nr:neutral zinc metallopeptidase [Murinocardiopsis flavida]
MRSGRAALLTSLVVLAVSLAVLVWSVSGPGAALVQWGGGPSSAKATGGTASPGSFAEDGHRGLPGGGAPSGGGTGRPTGEDALVDNPLYATGRLAPLPCPAPDLDVTESASMKALLDTVADCLDHTWATQFARAGIPYDPPQRVFWEVPGTSPCRDYPSSAGAFYCRASKSIYIGTSDVVRKWNGVEDPAVYASLLAHEYSHHVQGESGLLDYYHEQRRNEADRSVQNSWTRKSELQANCMAGAFLGAVRVSFPLGDAERANVLDDAAATADREGSSDDERTHGSADNSVRWMDHGIAKQDPGVCNTWSAADDLVQ